ncbi:MAG: sensor histidine kinase [Rufibacter sp.]
MEKHKKTIFTVLSHVVFWVLLLSLPLFFLAQEPGTYPVWSFFSYAEYWVFNMSFILLFYTHMYVLYPIFFSKGRYVLYGLSLVLLFLGFFFLRPFDRLMHHNPTRPRVEQEGMRYRLGPKRTDFPDHRPPRPPHDSGGPGGPGRREERFDMVSIFLFFLMVVLGIALQTMQRLREAEKRRLQAETDKANAELSFLKAQINPHFLFNTLNNIYSLAIADSEPTANAIMKLSNIMRYVTDDATADFVPLESEAGCIQDFIDLQLLRLSKQVQVTYKAEGHLWQKVIPPMVLMTFVENAFKYGVSNHEPATISIALAAEEQTVSFVCINTLFETPRNVVSTGIGLVNIRQRLAHLYRGKHSLEITQDNGFFTVHLTLQT